MILRIDLDKSINIKNIHKIIFSIGLIISITFLVSCDEDEYVEIEPNSSQIGLENLKKGDRYLYAYLIGTSYFDNENFDFKYTADTLEIRIIDVIGDKYLVQEKILPTSTIFQTDEKYLKKDSIYTNFWYVENDSLKISAQNNQKVVSHLFDSYYHGFILGFSLKDFEDLEINLKGWKTEYSYTGEFLNYYTTNFELLGNDYERLNVMIRNTPMQFDGDGWTHIYSRKSGFVRVISYSAWTGRGSGWDRI